MKNGLKTTVLLTILALVLLTVGQLVGGMSGLAVAIVLSLIFNFGAYFWSDKIILAMYRAKELKGKDNQRLARLVGEVAKLVDIPKPRIYIINSESPNAFATGRNPKKSSVAFTKGILGLLNDSELKGVIAHELSHIKNRDTLIQTVAASIAGVISYIAMIARWGAMFGGFGGRDDNSGGIVEFLALAIVMPIIAVLVQLAISRSRERLADENAAKTLLDGKGLASALEKLETESKKKPFWMANQATSSLFIVNPFHKGAFVNLLSTHPPIDERIRSLKSMNF